MDGSVLCSWFSCAARAKTMSRRCGGRGVYANPGGRGGHRATSAPAATSAAADSAATRRRRYECCGREACISRAEAKPKGRRASVTAVITCTTTLRGRIQGQLHKLDGLSGPCVSALQYGFKVALGGKVHADGVDTGMLIYFEYASAKMGGCRRGVS